MYHRITITLGEEMDPDEFPELAEQLENAVGAAGVSLESVTLEEN